MRVEKTNKERGVREKLDGAKHVFLVNIFFITTTTTTLFFRVTIFINYLIEPNWTVEWWSKD